MGSMIMPNYYASGPSTRYMFLDVLAQALQTQNFVPVGYLSNRADLGSLNDDTGNGNKDQDRQLEDKTKQIITGRSCVQSLHHRQLASLP